jgi:amidohydrolase
MNEPITAVDWEPLARALEPDLVALRRGIHADPELGLDCPRTAATLRAFIADYPLEIFNSSRSSGFVAILRGKSGRRGRTVLLRGDMDALPMDEQTGLTFSSARSGAMHACGHDLHSAMLAGAVRLLCAHVDMLVGDVVFMFQPGEEGAHGARVMIEEGLLDICPADTAFALHVTPNLPTGIVASRAGALMASTDTLAAKITGRGGHAAMPHQVQDPVPIACEIVLALQHHLSRRVAVTDPAVLSITRMIAGSADNVIPDEVELRGTLRTFSQETRDYMRVTFTRIVETVAAAHGLTGSGFIEEGYPPCRNDPHAVALLRSIVAEPSFPASWSELPDTLMTGEDFAYVLAQIPGAMAIVGAAPAGSDPGTNPPVHHARMQLNEDAMRIGVQLLCRAVETAQSGHRG